jgi:hypothetical protein
MLSNRKSKKHFASYKYTSLANFHNLLFLGGGVTAPIGFVAETTTHTTQQVQEKNIDALSGIRIRNPKNRAATGIGFYPIYHTPFLDPEVTLPPG